MIILKSVKYRGVDIEIVRGDITQENVDAIVNAANGYLMHGGGVAGAIVRRGGYEIQEESNEIINKRGKIRTGEAVVTSGGKLKARYVIHAVGPVWNGGNLDEDSLLFNAVYNSLRRADELKLKSISMPAISTGIFRFPKERAVGIFSKAIKKFLDEHKNTTLQKIRLCNIDEKTSQIFASKFRIEE